MMGIVRVAFLAAMRSVGDATMASTQTDQFVCKARQRVVLALCELINDPVVSALDPSEIARPDGMPLGDGG